MNTMTKHPEFPLTDELIYLNHAAVAPWPKRTSAAVIQVCRTKYPLRLALLSGLAEQGS